MSEARQPFRRKGDEVRNPENPEQGYRLTRDVSTGEYAAPDQFEAFGGAPEPKAGEEMPVWLGKAVGVYK